MSMHTHRLAVHVLRALPALIIPFVAVMWLLFNVRGPGLQRWMMSGYATFLAAYLFLIMATEYVAFDDLHRHKAKTVDRLLLGSTFVALVQVSRGADSIQSCLFWLAALLLCLVLWELYTMICGRGEYFAIAQWRRKSNDINVVGLHEATCHWAEYRYWVELDAGLLIVNGITWLGSGAVLGILSDMLITMAIFSIGSAIGMLNSVRYVLLVARIRRVKASRTTETAAVASVNTTSMQSVFISYGSPDVEFARKLHEVLRQNGLRTFFFEQDAVPGMKLHELMRDGVNRYDRVILVCSEQSLDRPGVLNEIEQTLARESRDGGAAYLIPITLDDYVFRWRPERAHLAQELRDRVVADFRGTGNDPAKFSAGIGQLLRALRGDPAA